MTVGDEVHHKRFGRGRVLGLTDAYSVLVEWETHRVSRVTNSLSTRQSHVKRTSLRGA